MEGRGLLGHESRHDQPDITVRLRCSATSTQDSPAARVHQTAPVAAFGHRVGQSAAARVSPEP